MTAIKFGTDGWRGIIAGDFTIANARIVAQAIARYVVREEDPRKGVLVGYDHRFAADRVAAVVADVISASGTPVWLADPTPAISLLVRQQQAAGGVVVTASHNPYSWNGIKYKASYGSSALPSIVRQIERELAAVMAGGVPDLSARKDLIQPLEPRAPYLDTVEKLIDWQRLRNTKFRFVVDPVQGTSSAHGNSREKSPKHFPCRIARDMTTDRPSTAPNSGVSWAPHQGTFRGRHSVNDRLVCEQRGMVGSFPFGPMPQVLRAPLCSPGRNISKIGRAVSMQSRASLWGALWRNWS